MSIDIELAKFLGIGTENPFPSLGRSYGSDNTPSQQQSVQQALDEENTALRGGDILECSDVKYDAKKDKDKDKKIFDAKSWNESLDEDGTSGRYCIKPIT